MQASQRIVPWLALLAAGCTGGGGGSDEAPLGPEQVALLAANDLGVHMIDRESSVFSLLPPYNVLRAQVVRQMPGGTTRLLDQYDVELSYEAVAAPDGSINTTSVTKSDFWDFAAQIHGVTLATGQGLEGAWMPADAPTPGPQPMDFADAYGWFLVRGLPITPYDDLDAFQPFPMMRIKARDLATGTELASVDVVVPVSNEASCGECHETGGIGASAFGITWSNDPDLEVQSKQNILALHDARRGSSLQSQTPLACASCHYSVAFDYLQVGPVGAQAAHTLLARAVHVNHGQLVDLSGQPVFPPEGTMAETCYRCHPGSGTQFARGPMIDGGMNCRSCHGDLDSLAGLYPLLPGGSLDGNADGLPRRPWIDVPRCQSCHSGDATGHLQGPDLVFAPDGIRLVQAWRTGDDSASPLLAVNKRFAENDGRQYRFSRGHGGVSCEGCHGSTHAEWPNSDPGSADNVAAIQLQGHAGVISECTACHVENALPMTLGGPHGLHPVGDQRWVSQGHGPGYAANPAACQACHGIGLEGTVLSRTATSRSFQVGGQTQDLTAGTLVSCDLCHAMP